MFGQWLRRAQRGDSLPSGERLRLAVEQALSAADPETVLIVTSMVGLLGIVGYADGNFSHDEQAQVQAELGRISGMTPDGSAAICSTLKQFVSEISALELPHFCRTLRELADVELRLQVLEMLVSLAAADSVVTTQETNVLRHMTSALGLQQSDYNAAQARHKERLAVLVGVS